MHPVHAVSDQAPIVLGRTVEIDLFLRPLLPIHFINKLLTFTRAGQPGTCGPVPFVTATKECVPVYHFVLPY